MTTLIVIIALVIIIAVIGYLLLEKRPGYGVYYGLAKLTGARLDIGSVDWATLRRHPTNDALVCPAERCPRAKPDREAPTFALEPSALLARLREVARAEAGTVELAGEGDRIARFIQYTRLMRYPDTIDIEVFPVDGQAGARASLAIYSRSLIGRGDFGVNRARIERWLAAVAS